jgi:PAS domain S-box-containing protein
MATNLNTLDPGSAATAPGPGGVPADGHAPGPTQPSGANVIFNAFDALQSQAAVLGHDGTILFVNEAWRQFGLQNGYAGSDLGIGRNYLDHADVEILDESGAEFNVRAALEKVLSGVSSGFYGEYVSDSPRDRRFFSVYAGPFVAGDDIGSVIVHTNITSRKVAMAELEAEREILQLIAAGAPLDQILNALSAAFEDLVFGSRCAIAAVAPEIAAFQSAIGDPAAMRVFEHIAHLSLPVRIHITGELCARNDVVDLAAINELIAAQDNRHEKEAPLSPGMLLTIRGTDDRPIGLAAMLVRTTAMSTTEIDLIHRLRAIAQIAILSARSQATLHQAQERYALAFAGAYDGLWDWDLLSDEVFRSTRCFEILGYLPEHQDPSLMSNRGWWLGQIHPDDLDVATAALDTSLEEGQDSFAIEYRMRRFDGSYCWVSDRGAIIRDPDGRAYRAAGSITDISARKLAEQQRSALEEQLRQIQKSEALGTLAGGIAHDINNTLVPVLGAVDLLLLDSTDKDTTELLRDVLSAANKIRDMVQQILSFSRKEATGHATIDLVAELPGILRMLRGMVPSTIGVDFDTSLSRFPVSANKTQLHQVLMNLVSNASSAIGSATGSIRVGLDQVEITDARTSAEHHVNPGTFARLSIIDTGPGIAPDIKARLFDPFFTTKNVGEGTGLGLTVVQGIVREHHGFIAVSNEPGAGARFDVFLPGV